MYLDIQGFKVVDTDFVIKVLCDYIVASWPNWKEIMEAQNSITKRYEVLREKLGRVESSHQAKKEWLQKYLEGAGELQ